MYKQNTPIIIVSHTWADAVYMSLLLSNHLVWPGELEEKRPFTAHDNYFCNEWVASFFSEPPSTWNNKELLLQLSVSFQEGFDSGKRYGLILPKTMVDHLVHESLLQEAILIDCSEHACECSLIHRTIHIPALFLQSKPNKVLQFIAASLGLTLVHEEKLKPQEIRDHAYWLQPNINLPSDKNYLAVFYHLDVSEIDSFLKRIKELYATVLTGLHIVCVLREEEVKQRLVKQWQRCFHESYWIDIIVNKDPIAVVEQLLQTATAGRILLDNTQSHYSFDALLSDDVCCMALPLLEDTPTTLELKELCNEYQLDCAISFNKQTNQPVLLHEHVIHEDILQLECAINYLLQFNQLTAVPCNPSVLPENNALTDPAILQSLVRSYTSLNAILMSSDNAQRSWHDKLIRMKTLLSHKEEELSSVQELTGQLHQRIQYLEANWYFRLRQKVQRIRKIFFKKRTPGKDGAKRIVQFLRFALSKTGFGMVRKVMTSVLKKLYLFAETRHVRLVFEDEIIGAEVFTYHDWITKKLLPENIKLDLEEHPLAASPTPLISIVMPVYNPPIKFLKEAIESVLNQSYTNWELCIADDCSPEPKVLKLLKVYAAKDARIKVHLRTKNGHISATSNDALQLATGEFILLMDHDDLLSVHCLTEVVRCIQAHPEADFIYSDEDKIDEAHHHQQAHFKPDWSPDNLLSRNYLGHVSVLRKTLIESVGGFRIGFEGSQDYDLFLRVTEQTKHIVHIPKVLYHWRIHGSSAAQSEAVKPYAYIAAKKALQEALERRGLRGEIKYLSGLRGYRMDYTVEMEELVSIIIPTKDQVDLLRNTVDSIFEKTNYKLVEVIVLNNNSTTSAFNEWRLEYAQKYPLQLQIVDAHMPFNFAKLMNVGAQLVKGKYLLLLNNDVEVIHPDWLHTMVSYAQQPRIGVVGAKLLYPDDTIQHAGVIVGLGGIAGHAFVGSYKDDPGYFNYIQSVNNFSALTAACLLMRTEVFHAVGGMNELFEVEYNDVDFCLRIREAGFDNVYLPQVELYHYESATRGHPHQSAASYQRHLKEMDLFKQRWQHYIDHDPHYNPNLNYGAHDFRMNFSA